LTEQLVFVELKAVAVLGPFLVAPWVTHGTTSGALRADALCRVMATTFAWAFVTKGFLNMSEGAAGR
jgi:hypothetical protein